MLLLGAKLQEGESPVPRLMRPSSALKKQWGTLKVHGRDCTRQSPWLPRGFNGTWPGGAGSLVVCVGLRGLEVEPALCGVEEHRNDDSDRLLEDRVDE